MANIELDGVKKKIKVDSGDLTLDVPGDIVLDADGGDVVFADGGTNLLKVTNSSSDVVLQPQVDTKDIVFKQYDGTTVATVEDNATFNIPASKLAIGGTAVTATAAELNLIDGGTARGTTAIADGDGVLINDDGTMRQTTVETLKTYIGGFDVSSITGATELSATPQKTDEFVMSDGGVLKRIDHEQLVNVNSPFAISAGWSNDQSISANTQTRITGFSSASTSGSDQRTGTISTSPTGRITPGEQGYYFMQFIFNIAGMSDGEGVTAYIYSSHSDANYIVGQHIMSTNSQNPWVQGAFVGTVGNQNNNYFEFHAKHNSGGSRTIENGHYRIFKLATKALP